MMTRTGFALSLLLTCAALACSDGKSDESSEDGSVPFDGSATAETGPSIADAARADGQAAEAPKPDAPVSDGAVQDSPAGQAPDGQAPIADAPKAAEAGAPVLDAASERSDAGTVVLVDARPAQEVGSTPADAQPDTMTDPVATDGGVDDVDAGSAQVPDAALDGPALCKRINCDCTFKGKKLWGKVQYVTLFPDFKVKVSSFPDLKVKETSLPTRCGEWQEVTVLPDFKVQIVDNFEDFSIEYSSFPGIP